MINISQTWLFVACASLVGVACSDDVQTSEPTAEGGVDSRSVDAGPHTTVSSPARSTSEEPTSQPSADTSAQTVTHASSSGHSTAPDASSGVDSTNTESSLDAGLDASSSAEDTSSSEVDTTDAASPGEVEFRTPRGPCDLDERIGRFTLEAQVDFGVVQGSISNTVLPTAIPSLEVESGDCRLYKRRTLTCLPACKAGQTCGEGGQCIPFPSPIDVGTVTVDGLTKPTSMSAQAPSYLYFAPGADNPPYSPGGEIILSAAGEAVSGFHLFGVGSSPLTSSPTWLLKESQDFEVTWSASDAAADTTVLVEVTVDQHGASPLSLSCEFPDTGSAVVPASLINQLLQAGISGFPNGRITRRTVDHVEVEIGCIELAVGSPRAASIVVAGHTPCDEPEDCPDGQHCNLAIEQCEDD